MKSLIKQPASTAGVKSDFGLEEAANEEEEACRNMITELMKGKNNRCPKPIYIKIIYKKKQLSVPLIIDAKLTFVSKSRSEA